MIPGVTAVIPVHNRADLLQRLLDTLQAQTFPLEPLVVDNASTDGAPELARSRGYRVIEMEENAGFARAVNRGWREAKTDWIAILNSDVELDSRWLERLTAAFGNTTSFATGTIFSAANPRQVDGTYDLVSRAACAWRAGHGEPARDDAAGMFPIAIAPATACIFRRDTLERLGGFDESFGSYLEDVDLGLRCVREGISGVFVPDAIAWHRGSATFGRWNPQTVRLISRNQVLLLSRHYDRALLRSCLWPILAGQLLWGLVALRHGSLIAWIQGKVNGLREFRIDAEPSSRLRDFLCASEREIRTRARDPYWRWYFRLTAAH